MRYQQTLPYLRSVLVAILLATCLLVNSKAWAHSSVSVYLPNMISVVNAGGEMQLIRRSVHWCRPLGRYENYRHECRDYRERLARRAAFRDRHRYQNNHGHRGHGPYGRDRYREHTRIIIR